MAISKSRICYLDCSDPAFQVQLLNGYVEDVACELRDTSSVASVYALDFIRRLFACPYTLDLLKANATEDIIRSVTLGLRLHDEVACTAPLLTHPKV
jgi:hypothetical protein